MKRPDIDIDVPSDFDAQEVFPEVVRASRVLEEALLPHPCGYYFQNIPEDKISKLSAIPYREAEDLGYSKIDFLHLHVYDVFQTQDEIRHLIQKEPDWNLMGKKEIVEELFQLSKHWKTVEQLRPRSIQEVADVITIIRPGKKHLINQYARGEVSQEELYSPDSRGYFFKKSHAYGYAHVVKLQLHILPIS